jgi:hypothetical protein
MPEMTVLDWLCHEISNHLLCGAPFNGQLLHIHLIGNEEIVNVDIPGTFPSSEGQNFDLAKYTVSSTRYEYSIQYIVSYDTIHCF